MSNFREMVLEVQNFISDTSDTTETIIKTQINDAINSLMQSGLWKFSMRQTTLTTTSGIADYYLPSDMGKIISMTQREDDLQMNRIWIGDFDRVVPDPTNGGNGRPKHYMELLDDRVLAQPTTSAKVTAYSTSNQDLAGLTGSGYATIYGQIAGVDRNERLGLSATNVISSTNSFSKIYSITTDISCAGTLAFNEATVGTNLLTLYPGESTRAYKKFKVYPTPDGTYTLYVTYQSECLPMINDSDVPNIPNRYLSTITTMVIGQMLLRQGDAKATAYMQQAQQAIDSMLKDEDESWDYVPKVRFGERSGYYDAAYPFRYY